MNAVQEDVSKLVAKELKSANEKFPLFRSPHEGYAVIKEELEEVKTEVEAMSIALDELWRAIKNNNANNIEYISMLKKFSMNCAMESIQVAAMAQKYLDSKVK